MKKQQGFTLIELMIVVAIIAILAAIAIPQYQNYVSRSQVTRVMGEAGQLKTAIEDCYNNGVFKLGAAAGECNPSATGSNIQASGGNAAPGVTIPATSGVPTITGLAANTNTIIEAKFGNNASGSLTGKSLKWTRDAVSGSWACSTTADPKFRPNGCTN